MKIVDGHAFLGRTIYVNQDLDSLTSYMDRLGIEVSVVVAPPPGPFYEDANRIVQEAVRKYPERLVALYRANPHLEGEADRVENALQEQGFVGVQMDPTNDGYGVGNSVVEPIIKAAEEHSAHVYVHSGDSIFCPPEDVADLAAKFEAVDFVMPMSRRAPRAARDRSNLYLMTRPFPTLAFQRGYAENFDLERVIFATDSPIGCPEIELRRVELADLDPEVKLKILGGNLRRIIPI